MTSLWRWVYLTLLTACFAFLGVFAAVTVVEAGARHVSPYWQRFEVAGVLRNTDDGWVIQSDARHQPVGMKSVRSNDTHLVVEFDESFDVVHSGGVDADEYFTAGEPTRAGLSLGLDRAHIYFATPDGTLVHPDDISGNGNFFFQASGSVLVVPPEPTPVSYLAHRVMGWIMRATAGN